MYTGPNLHINVMS